MSLEDMDYTKRKFNVKASTYQTYNRVNNSGKSINVEDFIQASYAEAVKKRNASIFVKIKNKIAQLLKL